MTLFTALSRVLGLVRDIAIAVTFGASVTSDAFVVAFKLPNILRRLFTEGGFAAAAVPALVAARERGGRAAAAAFLSRALVGFVLGGSVLAICLAVAAPAVILALAPGFAADPARYAAAVDAFRWMTPYVPFVCVVAMLAAASNTLGRFAAPAFAPVLLNLCIIAAVVLVAARSGMPATTLALAVSLAGVLQCGWVAFSLRDTGMLVPPRAVREDAALREFGFTLAPVLLAASASQINMLVDTWVASYLPTGAVSWLYYADRLLELPVGLIAAGLATVALPTLAGHVARADARAFSATLDWLLAHAALVAIPAACALALLAQPIVATLFVGGAFTSSDAQRAGDALTAYAPGLVGLVAAKLLLPAFFARRDIRTPTLVALACIGGNLALSIALMDPFGHVGLAAATALAATIEAVCLATVLVRRGHFASTVRWAALLARVGVATVVLGVLLAWCDSRIDWYELERAGRVGVLALVVAAGLVAYGTLLLASGVRGALPAAPRDL